MNSQAWEPRICEGSQEVYKLKRRRRRKKDTKACWKLCIHPSASSVSHSKVSFFLSCRTVSMVKWLWDLLLIRISDWQLQFLTQKDLGKKLLGKIFLNEVYVGNFHKKKKKKERLRTTSWDTPHLQLRIYLFDVLSPLKHMGSPGKGQVSFAHCFAPAPAQWLPEYVLSKYLKEEWTFVL